MVLNFIPFAPYLSIMSCKIHVSCRFLAVYMLVRYMSVINGSKGYMGGIQRVLNFSLFSRFLSIISCSLTWWWVCCLVCVCVLTWFLKVYGAIGTSPFFLFSCFLSIMSYSLTDSNRLLVVFMLFGVHSCVILKRIWCYLWLQLVSVFSFLKYYVLYFDFWHMYDSFMQEIHSNHIHKKKRNFYNQRHNQC